MKRDLHRGETLLESLAAMLILALSTALLLTGIGAAVRINRQTDEQNAARAEARTRAETQAAPGESAAVTVTFEDGQTLTLPVAVYGAPEGPASYREVQP